MKKKITYRPSKAQGAFSTAVGGIFVLIGLFVVIPTFGPFGLLWTLVAVGITAMSAYQAFGKGYAGPEIRIEDEEEQRKPSSPSPELHDHIQSTALGPQKRLEQLKDLKEAGLIDEREYQQKREEILNDL